METLESTKFPPNLIQLHLSDNKLTQLPESIFKAQMDLQEVTLSGNPWKCDYNAVNFKKWLTTEKSRVRNFFKLYAYLNNNNNN